MLDPNFRGISPEMALELQIYIWMLRIILVGFIFLVTGQVTLAASNFLRQWRHGRTREVDLFMAGRDIQSWLDRGEQRSVLLRPVHGEWELVVIDPELDLMGTAALQLCTSPERPLGLTVKVALQQLTQIEWASAPRKPQH